MNHASTTIPYDFYNSTDTLKDITVCWVNDIGPGNDLAGYASLPGVNLNYKGEKIPWIGNETDYEGNNIIISAAKYLSGNKQRDVLAHEIIHVLTQEGHVLDKHMTNLMIRTHSEDPTKLHGHKRLFPGHQESALSNPFFK